MSEGIKDLLIRPQRCWLIKLFSSKGFEVWEGWAVCQSRSKREVGWLVGWLVGWRQSWALSHWPAPRLLQPAPSEGQGSPLRATLSHVSTWTEQQLVWSVKMWIECFLEQKRRLGSKQWGQKSGGKWGRLKKPDGNPFSGFVMPSFPRTALIVLELCTFLLKFLGNPLSVLLASSFLLSSIKHHHGNVVLGDFITGLTQLQTEVKSMFYNIK